MDAKQPSATNPTDTQADNDKYATTRQAVSNSALLWLRLKREANFPLSFGRYEMQRVLGEGAMAAVYLAQDQQLGRNVAIKIPKFEPNDQAGMKRFFREARTMATLRHPHLCPVYDVGEFDGLHYFTMAFIEGGTLADRIAADAPMSSRRVAVLIAKIAAALHAAHQTGAVHRDLKPANIMIDQNNEPVLMDFGLAGLAEAESSLTRSGEMIGTPAYMAPEQITGDLPQIGPPSDVYGLGAIMYEMLTGQLPFAGSVASVVQQALQTAPRAPTSVQQDVDPALGAICMKAMARESQKRFASAEELAIALRDYLRGVSAPPSPTPAIDVTTAEQQWETDAIRVRELWRSEQFAAALTILERLAQLTGSNGAKYAEWAQQEIPKVREQIELANHTVVRTATCAVQRREPGGTAIASWLKWTIVGSVTAFAGFAIFVVTSTWNEPSSLDIAARRPQGKLVPVVDEVYPNEATPEDSPIAIDRPPVDDRPPFLPGEGDPSRGPHSRPSVDELIHDLDANGDGKLVPDEIPRLERPHLMRADADHDGFVTREELDIMYLFTPDPPPPRR